MPAKDKFTEFVIDRLSLLGRIDSRYMFGGWCLYFNGTVFALIADGALYLKGDENNIPAYLAAGCKPFQPFPDKPDIMKYYQAPPEIFEDDDALKHWCNGAIQASLNKGKKKKKK